MDYKKVLGEAIESSGHRGGWLSKLSVKQFKEMELLRNAYQRLELARRPSVETLRRMIAEELNITIGKDSFREWLKSPNSSSVQSKKTNKSSKSVRTSVKSVGKG